MTDSGKLRVLWLSNALLEPTDRGLSGTWLHAMAAGLLGSERIELGNVTTGRVEHLTRADYGRAAQWITPVVRRVGSDGLPDPRIVRDYQEALQAFKPDVIHVWGAETFPGLLVAREIVKGAALLEIQGLKGPWAEVYHGGLTPGEQLRCTGPKELMRRATIPQIAASFRKWGVFEQEIIKGFRFITTPSPWMAAHAWAANPTARLFENAIALRRELLACPSWGYTAAPILFCSSSYPLPYKGLHTLIRAAALLRRHYPNLQVRIAGAHQASGWRLSGYVRWLNGEIVRAGLGSSITWLGSINAAQVCEELRRCSAAVFPSYAESYGVAHAEAMAVGTPCVLALNGGSTFLAEPGRTGLFFPPGDHAVCASQIRILLENQAVAESISRLSREVAMRRHDSAGIVRRQLAIYHAVAADSAQALPRPPLLN
jgi:glycosyltransferase involved in cell wall biosynthesis